MMEGPSWIHADSLSAFEAASVDVRRALWEGLRTLQAASSAHVDAAMAIDQKAQDVIKVLAVEAARIEEARHLIEAQKAALEDERRCLEAQGAELAAARASGRHARAAAEAQAAELVAARAAGRHDFAVAEGTDCKEGGGSVQLPLQPASPRTSMSMRTIVGGATPGCPRGSPMMSPPPREFPPAFTQTMAAFPPALTQTTAAFAAFAEPGSSLSMAAFRKRAAGLAAEASQKPPLIDYAVTLGSWSYAVLPPRPAKDNRPSHEMLGQLISVPEGWEVLSTAAEEFPTVIRSLASRGWGTLRLVVRDADSPAGGSGGSGAGGFASFSTSLRPFGQPGERLSHEVSVLEEADDGRFRFGSGLVSSRLVVRTAAAAEKAAATTR